MRKAFLFPAIFTASLFSAACNSGTAGDGPAAAQPASATQALKEEWKENPDSLAILQRLIESYSDAGAYDSALALTDAQLKKDTANAFLWNMKATLHFENDDTTAAIHALERAVSLYPRPEYLVALGTVYAEIKDPRCLSIANDLMQGNRSKSGADAMFIRGMYYTYSHDAPKAILYYDSCLNLNYTYMFAYREKAIALYNMGQYAAALNVLKRAVTLQNNYDEGYYWMGRCLEKLGKKADAIQSYQTALLYDPDYDEARTALQELKARP